MVLMMSLLVMPQVVLFVMVVDQFVIDKDLFLFFFLRLLFANSTPVIVVVVVVLFLLLHHHHLLLQVVVDAFFTAAATVVLFSVSLVSSSFAIRHCWSVVAGLLLLLLQCVVGLLFF